MALCGILAQCCWIDLLFLKEAEDLRAAWNWQPSLIPFLQSKPAYSATVEHPVGGWFCVRSCASNVEERLSQQSKKVLVIVCIMAAIMVQKEMMIKSETKRFFKSLNSENRIPRANYNLRQYGKNATFFKKRFSLLSYTVYVCLN